MKGVHKILKPNSLFLFTVNGKYENCSLFKVSEDLLAKYSLQNVSRRIHYLSEEANYLPLIKEGGFTHVKSWAA